MQRLHPWAESKDESRGQQTVHQTSPLFGYIYNREEDKGERRVKEENPEEKEAEESMGPGE